MTADQAIEMLHTLPRVGAGGANLDRMKALLGKLGNPQKGLKFVHVAGTNGKGTVCSLTAAMLREAGYKTGLTISPYVVDFRERFQINGEMMPKRKLASLVAKVMKAAEEITAEGGNGPGEFEAVTAVAVLWFAEEKCDIVVMETGLGGRFDATNAVADEENLLLSVITRIGLDHVALLGDTVEQIAREKAGIFKQGKPVLCYPEQPQKALEELLVAAAEKECPWICPDVEDLRIINTKRMENHIDYGGYEVHLHYPGRHQALNAMVAVEIALELWRRYDYDIPDEAILAGLESADLPARIEVLGKYPFVILDGGHNEDGGDALTETLTEAGFEEESLVAVMGMMKDKAVDDYLAAVAPMFQKVFTVTPDNPRAMSAGELAEVAKFHTDVEACESVREAIRKARKLDSKGIVVCGSLYLAAEARPLLEKLVK